MTLPTTPISEMAFVPCDLVTIQVGRLSANVYPKVEPNMPTFEHANAFQVIKSALEPLPVDTCLILDAIGLQLNCSTILKGGLMFDLRNTFDTCWQDITSCDPNTTIIGDPTILLPVLDGPVATCHNDGIHFARITCTINFASLILIPHYGTLVLRVGFYIKLPQKMVVVVDSGSHNYDLTTWYGAANFRTLLPAQVRASILNPCLHDGLITLCATNINLNNVQIDDTSITKIIQAKILKLRFRQICASVFQQLCPGYSNQPHAAIKHIRQSAPGPNGQLIMATTIKYYQQMLNATQPFATQKTYAISVCHKFIQGLDRCILGPFCWFYPQHSTVHDLNSAYQCSQLAIILAAAQAAEDEVKQMQDIPWHDGPRLLLQYHQWGRGPSLPQPSQEYTIPLSGWWTHQGA